MTVTAQDINRQLGGFAQTVQEPPNVPARWNPDAFHAMQERDNDLIRDSEIARRLQIGRTSVRRLLAASARDE